MIVKIEISKIVFLIFHERLFQKKKIFIFLKRYSSGLLYSIYHFVLSFGYGENKKNWLSKLKFPKLFSSDFMNACFKKINIYIFEKISFSTILQYLQFCSLIWLRRNSETLIDKIEISKIVFLIFPERLFQKK